MHRLFSPKPKHEELVINTSYQYEVEDIQAILRLRLDSCHVPGLKILTAADMTGNYVGNRVADVLQQYMTELAQCLEQNDGTSCGAFPIENILS